MNPRRRRHQRQRRKDRVDRAWLGYVIAELRALASAEPQPCPDYIVVRHTAYRIENGIATEIAVEELP